MFAFVTSFNNTFTLKNFKGSLGSFATDENQRSIETCLLKSEVLCCLLVGILYNNLSNFHVMIGYFFIINKSSDAWKT